MKYKFILDCATWDIGWRCSNCGAINSDMSSGCRCGSRN